MTNNLMEIVMGLIVNGGDAKSSAMEAIQIAKEGNFDDARKKLQESDEALRKAHSSQTSMLTQEASGNDIEVSLLMVHAQDHLMNAITFRDLAEEIVSVHEKIDTE